MKILNLLRHAKSSWSASGLKDVERPLNKRGVKACEVMGPRMEQAGCGFDYIVSSPAQRAQQTIAGIRDTQLRELSWQTEADLYTFDAREVLEIIAALDNTKDEVLLVGHNPGFTNVSNRLSDARIDNVPTCAWVSIEFACSSWAEVVSERGRLRQFISPRQGSLV